MATLAKTIGELRSLLAELPDGTPITTTVENSSDSDTWMSTEDGVYVGIEPEKTSVHLSARSED